MNIDPQIVFALLQTVSTGLILICLWFARTLWVRVTEVEEEITEHRVSVQREIADMKLETMTRIVALENHID